MTKYIRNLEDKTQSVLQENLSDDAAELTGIDKDVIDDAVKGLSFVNYLELGNAIDIEDADTVREILNVTGMIDREENSGEDIPGGEIDIEEDRYEDETDECINCSGHGIADYDETCFNCGGRGRVMKNGEYIDDEWEEKIYDLDQADLQEAEYIKGKNPGNAKNYLRKGGNKQQFKWRIELNNGKVLLRWADTRYNAIHGQLSPEQHIIGVKSAKRVAIAESTDRKFYVAGMQNKRGRYRITKIIKDDRGVYDISLGKNGVWYDPNGGLKLQFTDNQGKPMTAEWIYNAMDYINEADNPSAPAGATPVQPAQPATAATANIPAVAQAATTAIDKDNQEMQQGRKEVDDLDIGDEIEVADIDGQPAAGRVRNMNGPGNTIVITGKGNEEFMIRKDSILSTPLTQIPEKKQSRLDKTNLGKKNKRAERVEKKKTKDVYEGDNVRGTYKVIFKNNDNAPDWVTYFEPANFTADNKEDAFRQAVKYIGKREGEYVKPRSAKLVHKFRAIGGPDMDQEILVDEYEINVDEMHKNLEKAIDEVAPPGKEDWIKKRKPEFKKRYGKDWESVLYATAWKQKNNEGLDEGEGEHWGVTNALHVTVDDAYTRRQVAKYIRRILDDYEYETGKTHFSEHPYVDNGIVIRIDNVKSKLPKGLSNSLKTAEAIYKELRAVGYRIDSYPTFVGGGVNVFIDNEPPEGATRWTEGTELGEGWPKPRDPWQPDAPTPDEFIKNGKIMKNRKGYKEWFAAQKAAANKGRLGEGADKHQKKIAIDTVKNPDKALLGGPSAKEAEETLRSKFGYDDKKIAKLKEGMYHEEETHAEMVEYWKSSLSQSIVRKGVFTQLYTAANKDIDELNAAIEDQAMAKASDQVT